MKKFLLLIFVFSLCFACVFASTALSAFAAESSDVKLKLDETLSGDELTVVARLLENKGFISGVFRVEFDNAELTLESVKYAKTCEALDPFDNLENVQSGKATSLLVFYAGEGAYNTETGDLFTMTFRVKEGATNGKHKVSMYITELFKTSDPNEKFNGQDETLDDAHSGGVLAAETEYFITDGVPAPEAEGEDHTLVIVLATVGGALLVAGIILGAYFAFRKKQKQA